MAAGFSVSPRAATEKPRPPAPVGAKNPTHEFTQIRVQHFQDEPPGGIKDLGIDLVNGRSERVAATYRLFGQAPYFHARQ